MKEAATLLKHSGQQKRVDELVTAINPAAEAAVPEAKSLLVGAVKAMSVEEAKQIITGSDTALTQLFVAKTRAPLNRKFLPIVTSAAQKVPLAQKYDAVAGKASDMGLVGKDGANIEHDVTGKTRGGLYLMITEEVRKIRKDPIGTGSAILAKVFGSEKGAGSDAKRAEPSPAQASVKCLSTTRTSAPAEAMWRQPPGRRVRHWCR